MTAEYPYTTKENWADYYQRNFKPRNADTVTFDDLFSQYLGPNPDKSVLEVGCAGGIYLAHFAKKYGYQPTGIDYSDEIDTANITFRHNNLPLPTLQKTDFFTWQPQKRFDVVCSVGFVEHFTNLKDTVRRHADLVAPNGTLIITMPHFAGAQYYFHRLLDNDNLAHHNISSMNPEKLRTILSDLPFKIQYLNYYKTFGFWTERDRASFSLPEKAAFWTIRKFGKILQVVFGYNRPNRWFSPHIVCIAKRLEA